MLSIRSLINSLVVVVLLNVMAACAAPPAPTSIASPATPLVISQAVCENASKPSTPPDLRMPPRPVTLLGGGLLTEDQFTFDLWLYCDPDLSPAGNGALWSEIGSLGIHLAWRYHGPEVSGKIESFLGFGNDREPRTIWEGGLAPGTVGSFTGGMRSLDNGLTRAVRSDEPISFKIIITVDDRFYGADLTFTMSPVSDGFRPTDIVVSPLRP